MKRSLLRIYLSLLVLGSTFLFLSTPCAMVTEPHRLAGEYKPNMGNIIILVDQFGDVKSSDDAMINDFLYALDQGVAFVLISNSIWNVFVAARKDFYEEIQQPETFPNRYKLLFDQANEYLREIDVTKSYDKQAIVKDLKDKISSVGFPKDLIVAFLCYLIPTSWDEWLIYKNDAFHLLIPKKYIQAQSAKRQLSSSFLPHHQVPVIYDRKTGRKLTDSEIILGLKTNNMQKVIITDSYDLPSQPQSSTRDILRDQLFQVFINKQDKIYVGNVEVEIDKMTTQEKTLFLSWIISLSGHGSGLALGRRITGLQRAIEQEHKRIGFVREPKKFKRLAMLCEEFEKIISRYNIAGMSAVLFIGFLNFLRDFINTDLLVYSSCFAGGIPRIVPYQSLGLPDIYNFPIIVGSATDLPTSISKPLSLLAIREGNLRETAGKLSLGPSREVDYGLFFDALNKRTSTRSWADIANYIIPFKTEEGIELKQIPLMRSRGMDKFVPVQLKEVLYLTSARIGMISILDKEAVLVGVSYCRTCELNIPRGKKVDFFPAIVSLNPQLRQHFIEAVNAHDWAIYEVLYNKGFLGALPELEEQEAFLMGSLSVKSEYIRLPGIEWFQIKRELDLLMPDDPEEGEEEYEETPEDKRRRETLEKALKKAENEPITLKDIIILRNSKDIIESIVKPEKIESSKFYYPGEESTTNALFFTYDGKGYFNILPKIFTTTYMPVALDEEEARRYKGFYLSRT